MELGPFLVAHTIRSLPAVQETRVQSLGREDSPGEGNGNPLQYPCLENSMEGGAWQATVHGVTESRTRLSDCTSLSLPSRQPGVLPPSYRGPSARLGGSVSLRCSWHPPNDSCWPRSHCSPGNCAFLEKMSAVVFHILTEWFHTFCLLITLENFLLMNTRVFPGVCERKVSSPTLLDFSTPWKVVL